MTLSDGQYRYRGLVVGIGTAYRVTGIEGLEGARAVRAGDRELPRGDGAVPGEHFLSARAPILDVAVVGPRAELMSALLAAFKPARSSEFPLTFKRPGRAERRVWARVVSTPVREQASDGPELTWLSIGLRCSDPRVYGEVEQSAMVPLHNPGGVGYFDYPDDYPKNASSDGGNEAVADNEGDSDAFPLVRFFGPTSGTTTRMRVQNTSNGSEVDVTTDVVAGQILSCRMREYVTGRRDVTIVDLSGASRYGDWDSRPKPLRLSPGDNVLRFTAEGDTDGVACVVSWRHTWDGSVE